MPRIDKPDVKLGFYIALGFFIFGLVVAAIMWLLRKAQGAAGSKRSG
jgi:hypothetical protein